MRKLCSVIASVGMLAILFLFGAATTNAQSSTMPIFELDDQPSASYFTGSDATFRAENIKENGWYRVYIDTTGSDRDLVPKGKTLTSEGLGPGESPYFVVTAADLENGSYRFTVNLGDTDNPQPVSLCIGKYRSPNTNEPTNENACIPVTISRLPALDYDAAGTCEVTQGEDITFNSSRLMPNTEYIVFYASGCSLDGVCGGVSEITEAAFTTGDKETSKAIKITPEVAQRGESICIDRKAGGRTALPQNCIDFNVIKDSLAEGEAAVCDKNLTPTPTPQPPHPPCPEKYITWAPDKNNPTTKGAFAGCGMIWTGLGIEVSTNPTSFIRDIFGILLSISGSLLLLLVIYSGYQFMTSQGDPEKIKAARERIMSAIIGFIFLVFSLVILEAIGVNILRLPGFEGGSSNTAAPQATQDTTSDSQNRRSDSNRD